MASYKELAREHQALYRKSILKINEYNQYTTMLCDEDAKTGKIFYDGFKELMPLVKKRYPYDRRKAMYANMLRSEHIPFNFFLPFAFNNHSQYLGDILTSIHPALQLTAIDRIDIEWAPPKKELYLNDLTSFDVFICARSDCKRIGIGVEVKYTETSYPYGKQEYQRMFDPDGGSLYHLVSRKADLYLDGAIELLRGVNLKQVWRNHLLGASMLLQPKREIDEFYSLHLYPSQNTYQHTVCDAYHALLKPEAKRYFVPVTYEQFIETARNRCKDDESYCKWLDYLLTRYIVNHDTAHDLI